MLSQILDSIQNNLTTHFLGWLSMSVDDSNDYQWRNDGVAAASSDGGPTGGRGPRQF